MYILESVTELKKVAEDFSLLDVVVSGKSYKTFMNYREALTLLNQEIVCSFSVDVVEGQTEEVIREVAKKQVVNVLPQNEKFKLYSELNEYCKSNVVFNEIKDSEFGCIVYCVKSEYKQSAKADWVECKIMDKNGRLARLYWFNVLPGSEINYSGNYLRGNLNRTPYGFSSQDMDVISDMALGENPEITLAVDYLNSVAEECLPVKDVMDALGFIEAARYYLDDDEPEPGYVLVRLAAEIYLARTLDDISPIVSKDVLTKALFARRLYVLTNSKASIRSRSLQSLLILARQPMGKDAQVMHLLDKEATPVLPEMEVISLVQNMVDSLIKMRRYQSDLKPFNHKFWEERMKK